MPITISISGGSSYYIEPEPFHTFYRTSGSYPSYGISKVDLTSKGHHVNSVLNYLMFDITFTRSDVNGLIVEIPVVNADGTLIYNDP